MDLFDEVTKIIGKTDREVSHFATEAFGPPPAGHREILFSDDLASMPSIKPSTGREWPALWK